MNDQPITPPTQDPVDDVVAQAAAIKDLFKQNDANPSTDSSVVNSSMTAPISDVPAQAQQTSMPATTPEPAQTPVPAPGQPQKSPLDILEEILNKEEKKNAEASAPAQEAGPTAEELELLEKQKQEQQAMLDAARQNMLTEAGSDEQKKRDAIRQQQMDANKVDNPYEIRQIQHKKITG